MITWIVKPNVGPHNDTRTMRPITNVQTEAVPPRRLGFIAALYERDYRFLWSGYVCASFVMRMDSVALGWLVLEMTHSAFMVGLVGAVRFLGSMAGPWTGVAADRMDRRRLILIATSVLGTLVATLAILVILRRLEVWHLFAATLIRGVVQAFLQPAQQSMQADVLSPRDLPNGISLTTMAMNITAISGPVLCGLLLACCRPARRVWDWTDAEMILSLNWLTYNPDRLYIATHQGRILTSQDHGMSWGLAPFSLPRPIAQTLALEGAATGVQWVYVVMVGLQVIQLLSYLAIRRRQQTARRGQASIWQNIRDGLRHSIQDPALWTPLFIAGLVNLVSFPLQFNLLPVFAREVFSVGAAGLGWLGAALGAGALLGSMLMVAIGTRFPAGPLMLVGTGVWSLFQVVFALTPNYYVGLGILLLTGMAQTMSLTNITIMLLSRSTSDMRGRIMGLRSLAVAPLFLGSMLSGAAAEEIGAPLTTIVCAVIGLAGTLGVAPWVFRNQRRT
ncbi:MFS transporter [Candidatus Entotheonella palauensis]|uniref:MFS transporter n=1 Tax=Candidatus Entotheonella palauensis TaxID=93172 RepID=UPI0015C452EB|nr:MFS transporter [Candidatus Entotheonella palauensis]